MFYTLALRIRSVGAVLISCLDSSTCREVVSTTKSFQAKFFMEQDAMISAFKKSGANEFRWNSFLVRYGVPLRPTLCSHEHRIKMKSEDLQYLDRRKASCRRMLVAYPTMLEFRVFLKLPSGVDLLHNYTDKGDKCREGVRMNFLESVGREGFDTITIVAGY